MNDERAEFVTFYGQVVLNFNEYTWKVRLYRDETVVILPVLMLSARENRTPVLEIANVHRRGDRRLHEALTELWIARGDATTDDLSAEVLGLLMQFQKFDW